MVKSVVLVNDYVLQRAKALNSRYKGNGTDTRHLMRFMEVNQWFDISHNGNGLLTTISAPVSPATAARIDLWLSGYALSIEEKLEKLLDFIHSKANQMIDQWESFLQQEKRIDPLTALNCLDYLFANSDNGQIVWSNDNVEKMLREARIQHLSKDSVSVLIRFSCYMLEKEGTDRSMHFRYHLATVTTSHETVALPKDIYGHLAWMVLDEEPVQAGHYIEKAAHDRVLAETWFLVAMHFVSALRIPDIQLLPVPHLKEPGAVLRQNILNGNWSIGEAEALVNNWLFLIEIAGRKPHKTLGTRCVPQVCVNIPTSLFPVFGQILGLVASFHEDEQPLIRNNYIFGQAVCKLFGDEFYQLCGRQFFVGTLQFNKAYLQGVEDLASQEAENGTVHIQGYLVASLLRGHRQYPHELAEVTDHYLKDAAFTGLSAEVVAREMFERGVFGFIPAFLLSQYSADWPMLSLSDQTLVIQELAITPAQIEHITRAVQQARLTTLNLLKDMFGEGCQGDVLKQKVGQILKRIAEGNAPGKSPGNMCLLAAVGKPCCDNSRSFCLGCGYELWTRSSIELLTEEYCRNLRAMKSDKASMAERMKWKTLNTRFILPVLQEILLCIQTYYGDEPVAETLVTMVRRRLEHADTEN